MKIIYLFLLLLSCHAAFAQAPPLDSALSYLHDRALFNGVVLLAENGKVVYQFYLCEEPLKKELSVRPSDYTGSLFQAISQA